MMECDELLCWLASCCVRVCVCFGDDAKYKLSIFVRLSA